MAGKKIIVNVDIQAQAEQLNKIVQQSRQSLKSLSPQIDKSQFTALENAFNKISKNAATLSTNLKTGLNSPSAFATAEKNVNKLYEDYANTINKIKSLGIDPNKIIPDFAQPTKRELDEMRKQLKTEGSKAGKEFGDNLQKALQQALSKGDVKGIKDLGKQAQAELTKANRSIISQTANIGKQYGTDAGGASKAIEAEMAKVRAMSAKEQHAYRASGGKSIGQMEQDLGVANKYNKYKSQHAAIGNASVEYQKQAQSVQQLTQKIQQLETELQKMAGPAQQKATQGLNQLATSEQQVKTQTDAMKGAINDGANSLQNMNAKASQLQQLKSYFGYMFSATSIVMKLGQAVRNAVKDFKDLDKQLNEISIVTGKSMDELWNGFSRLNSTAQKYGVVTSDVVSVQKLYYQQGRSVSEVNELTGKTLTFAKISGLEFAEATEYMTAALNAYKIEARDANIVTDTYAALSMSAAVDAEELAVAMSKVASLAALSGAELQDTSAYLTKIIETTREAPETAGTALKTVIARFTAVNKLTADQKELLEEDYNFNNIEKALKTVDIAVKDSAGQMRGFTEIVGELGPKWDKLDSNTKHYIATQAAGARQQSRFIALMDDWARTEELMGVAADSAGTGAEQLELAMDSIETKANQLKATWQSFYASFVSSDFLKNIYELATGIVGILDGITSGMNKLSEWLPSWASGLTTVLSVALVAIGVMFVSSAIKFGKSFGSAFMASYRATIDKSKIGKNAKEVADAYTQGVAIGKSRALGEQAGEAEVRGNRKALKTARRRAGRIATNAAQGTGAAVGGVAGGLGKIAGTIGSFLSAAMPYVLVAVLAVGVISAIVSAVKKADTEKEQEAAKEVKSSSKEIDNEIKKTTSLQKNYTKALKLHNKGLGRTEEETEEYQKILSELNETFPQMVTKTADGLYKLEEASEEFYNSTIRASEAAISAAHERIRDNAQLAAGAGVYLGAGANELNEEIKSVASALSEQSEDQVKFLGNSNKNINVKDITKMTEQGLTREAINEFGWDYSTKAYEEFMDSYVKLARDAEGRVDVNALGGGQNKEVLTWFNALNAQYGGDLIQKLWESTFGENIMKTEITNWADFKEAETGEKLPEKIEEVFIKNAERERNLKLYGNEEGKININDTNSLYGKKYNEAYTKSATEWAENNVGRFSSYNTATQQTTWTLDGETATTKEDAINMLIRKAVNSEMFKESSIKAADEYAQSYTGQEFVNLQKENMTKYLALNDKVNASFERIMTSISNGTVGAGENIEVLMNSLGVELDDNLREGLESVLEELQAERLALAKEYIEGINALTNGSYTQNNFSDWTTEQLGQMKKVIQNTSDLYGKAAANEMADQYKAYFENVLSGNEKLKSAFANIDFFDAKSIAQYGAEVLKYGDESSKAWEDLGKMIDAASNATDRATRDLGTLFKESAEEVKKLKDSFSDIEGALKGELGLEEVFDLISNNSSIIGVEDFTTTGEGFKLNIEDATELAGQMLQTKINELRIEEEMYRLKQASLQNEIQKSIGDDWNADLQNAYQTYVTGFPELAKNWDETKAQEVGSAKEKLANAGILSYAEQDISLTESQAGIRNIIEMMGKMTIRVDDGVKEAIEKFEALADMLAKIGEYIDIDAYSNYLEANNKQQEFVREFSTNTKAITDATKTQMTNLNNLLSASVAKTERATLNTQKRRESLESEYGDYVDFDEHGNVMMNEVLMSDWAKRISNMALDTSDAGQDAYKNEKKKYDLMHQRIEEYKEEHKLIQDSTDAANDYMKQIEDLNKELKESVTKMEDAFIDLFIKRDEEALESTRKRYEELQEMDNDYLDSVREAVEKERQLRDRSNEAEDLAKMEKQLELMRMSGGSATEIQALEQEIAQKRQDMADQRQDDAISEMERQNTVNAENMNRELEFQEMTLEEKKKNMILYNQEVAALMQQDKETIMNTWKELDTEFQTSTSANKDLLEQEMAQMVASGLSAKETLADDYIQAVETAYSDVKDETQLNINTLGDYVDEVAKAGGKNGVVIKNVGNMEQAYLNVEKVIDDIIALGPQLTTELSKAAQYVSLLADTSKITLPDSFNSSEGTGGNNVPPPTKTGDLIKFSGDAKDVHTKDINVYKLDGNTMTDLGKSVSTGYLGGDIIVTGTYNHNGTDFYKIKASSGWDKDIGNSAANKLLRDGNLIYIKKSKLDAVISARGGSKVAQYATGGMVDYTGPAWVDGTKSKPEAFLSANDTQLIASLRDILRANPKFGSMAATTIQKTGDTYYEIHINVDELGDGYSVDDLMNELEERIVQVTDKNTVIKVG